ncbi:hypothetical protein ACFZBU_33480 [Embleya sp. NPDC008237]|uniref:hypothetical protein n=1 Tax=Embleya sp. NPDC008237 TaxID=3363978 RepID=UPI0036ED5EED
MLTVLAAVSVAVCVAVLSTPGSWSLPHFGYPWFVSPGLGAEKKAALAVLAVSGVFIAYIGGSSWFDFVRDSVIENDRSISVLSGLLIAVLGCQPVIGRVVKPLVDSVESAIGAGTLGPEVREFFISGNHIGWIERLLLFAFLASSHPEAAALVIAAKSFARAPGISQGGKLMSEYYLIGTLASVASALVAAVATRLAIGLPPL